MAIVLNYGVVFTGENLPVRTIDPNDFDFASPPDVKLQLGLALHFEVDKFLLLATPDRYQMVIQDDAGLDVTDDDIQSLVAKAEVLIDYAGRRSIEAVGANSRFQLDEIDGPTLWSSLVETSEMAKLNAELPCDMLLTIPAGDASTAKATFMFSKTDPVRIEFNYHFDLKQNVKTQRPINAVHRLGESLGMARKFVEDVEAVVKERV